MPRIANHHVAAGTEQPTHTAGLVIVNDIRAQIAVLRTEGAFIDIGVPESLGNADAFIDRHLRQASR